MSPPAMTSSMGLDGEPPCRQRRLEPWRHQIRKVCLADADSHCQKEEERDLRISPMESPFDHMEVNSLFNAMFANPSQVQNTEEEVDPFESIFNSMLDFSLRAFDEMMIDVVSVSSEEETEEETEEEDALPVPRPSLSSLEEGVTPPAEPAEQAAENALDAMVASLAQRFVQKEEEVGTTEEEEEDMMIPSVVNLPQILFQLGNDLRFETHSTRRRLMEEGGERVVMDPHYQVKERLARRLTEYRTDLFFDSDGTVTMYTTSGLFPSSAFMAPPSSSMGGNRELYETPLGMGSSHVDQCMKSRFDNGDLGEPCHEAVEQLFLAVDNRFLPPPSKEAMPAIDEEIYVTVDEAAEQEYYVLLPKSHPHDGCSFIMYGAMFFAVVLVWDKYFSGSDEGGEDDDDDDNEETSDGYARLPEDDSTNERPVVRGEPRVFMGVPVQVV